MKSKTIKLYEDNGGGLHMTDGETVVSGFEYQDQPGGLENDMRSWDDWCHLAADVSDDVDGLEGLELIAILKNGNLELYREQMGKSGSRYAGE